MSILYARNEFKIQNSKFKIVSERSERTLGGYCGGVPPLPIPNREVKPACADGTAMQCGRVGGCLLLLESSRSNDFGDLFLFPYLKTKIYYCLVVFAIKCIFAPWKVHIWQVQTRRLCANLFKKL